MWTRFDQYADLSLSKNGILSFRCKLHPQNLVAWLVESLFHLMVESDLYSTVVCLLLGDALEICLIVLFRQARRLHQHEHMFIPFLIAVHPLISPLPIFHYASEGPRAHLGRNVSDYVMRFVFCSVLSVLPLVIRQRVP